MADLDLRTDYKDDILDSSVNEKRKYNIIDNTDGTKSLEDVSVYTQRGDSFGAVDINKTNQAVLDLNSSLTDLQTVETDTYTSTYLNGELKVVKVRKVVTINFPSLKGNMPLRQSVLIVEMDAKYGISSVLGGANIRVPDANNNNEVVAYTVSGNKLYFYKYGTGTNGTTTGCTLTYITD